LTICSFDIVKDKLFTPQAMITCFVTNWGVTIALGLLLTASEWLAKTKRFEENGLLDLTTHFLKVVLRKETKSKGLLFL
jgi:hypothetical protein